MLIVLIAAAGVIAFLVIYKNSWFLKLHVHKDRKSVV